MKLLGYVRVSLEEERPENQEFAVTRWVASKGYQLVGFCRDVGVSGVIPPLERPGFRECVRSLEAGEAEGIVVASLDRIARSLWELAHVFREFEERGWVILSVREEWLQSLDPKLRGLIVAILGWAGEMEREFIRERTREALARLRAEGKRIGRPPKWNPEVRRKLLEYVKKGYTLKDACKLVGIGYSTARRYLARDPEYLQARAEALMKKAREKR